MTTKFGSWRRARSGAAEGQWSSRYRFAKAARRLALTRRALPVTLPALARIHSMRPRSASGGSFEEAFRATFEQVVRFVARRVADPAEVADVVSATYLEALIHWERYDRRKGEPVVWFLGIARNLCARDARRRALESRTVRELAGQRLLGADEFEELEALIDAVRLAPAVASALRGLSARDRELFRMTYEDELTVGQAAALLGMTAVAARMRLMRVRRQVRAVVEPEDADACVVAERAQQ